MPYALLFNPQNDIALARDDARFTPPRQARLLAEEGAGLMQLLGTEADVLITENTHIAHPNALIPLPWGWSSNSALLMTRAGIDVPQAIETNLPYLRQLSHRRTAAEANQLLTRAIDWAKYGQQAPVPAIETTTIAQARSEILRIGNCFIKEPWSSSGRGVWQPSGLSDAAVDKRIAAAIARQGSVMIEPAYNKTADFAMLFSSHGEAMTFSGYSLFFNRRNTAYAGNIIASDSFIESQLTRYVSAELLSQVRDSLEKFLTLKLQPILSGAPATPMFAGVDMMIADNATLVPCVEINFRLTMGFVALALRSRYSDPQFFAIIPRSAPFPDNAQHIIPPSADFCFTISPANLTLLQH